MFPSNSCSNLVMALSIGVLTIIMIAGLLLTGMKIDLHSLRWLGLLICFQAGLAFYCHARKLPRLRAVAETNLFFTTATVVLLPTTYIALRFGMPLADDWLVEADAAIGFDWVHFVQFIDSRPWLAATLFYAYMSFHLQLLALPAYFALFSRHARGQAIVFAYLLIVLTSCIISIWFPTQGAYVAHGAKDASLQSIDTIWAFSYLHEFEQLRSTPGFVMDFRRVEGVLTFPSVHAAVALLCVWAASGSRYLFVPAVVVNAAMAFAAVSHASHFVIDIFAGFTVAAVCICVTKLVFPGCSPALSRMDEAEFMSGIRRRRGFGKAATSAAFTE